MAWACCGRRDGWGSLDRARHRLRWHLPHHGTRSSPRLARLLLGAAPGVAVETALRLRTRYPQLIVAGAYDGSPDDADWPAIAGWLAATQPDILFVAYGHPKQEYWIDRHRHELPVAVAMGVGGAFDFVAGVTTRAPRLDAKAGAGVAPSSHPGALALAADDEAAGVCGEGADG